MLLINDTYDLICLILGIIGTFMCVYLLYLSDWKLESLLFVDDVDTQLDGKEKR